MDEKVMLGQNVLGQLNKAFADAHPQFAAKYDVAVVPVEGFCAICAKVRNILNMAIKPIAIFKPEWAALAKTFMSVVFGTLIPMICPP